MAPVEDVVSALRSLSPEQLDEVAELVRELGAGKDTPPSDPIPPDLVDEAVRHGWSADLFVKLIGSLPQLERPPQPALQTRAEL